MKAPWKKKKKKKKQIGIGVDKIEFHTLDGKFGTKL